METISWIAYLVFEAKVISLAKIAKEKIGNSFIETDVDSLRDSTFSYGGRHNWELIFKGTIRISATNFTSWFTFQLLQSGDIGFIFQFIPLTGKDIASNELVDLLRVSTGERSVLPLEAMEELFDVTVDVFDIWNDAMHLSEYAELDENQIMRIKKYIK